MEKDNWLPCPDANRKEEFILYIRAYLAEDVLFNGGYALPQIRRVA